MARCNPACHLYAEFEVLPVSEGKKCHQRSHRKRPSVTVTMEDGINRHLRVRLLNIKVAPVTRISNSAVLEAIRKEIQLIIAEKVRSSIRVQQLVLCVFIIS